MKPLSFRIRAELFLQLSRMESAGLPYARAVATLSLPAPAQSRLKSFQALAAKGIDAARAGEQSGLFTRLESRLVRAALNAGSPGRIYERLAEHYTRRAMQWTAIKSRLTLPAFVLLLALFIQPLPALVGGALGARGYALQVIVPVLAIAIIVAALRSVPFRSPVFRRASLRDFFESLALMLEAGSPMIESLPAAIDTVADPGIRRELTQMRQRVERGETFATALEGVPCLRGSPVLAFAHTGEESGKLPELLMRHAAIETAAIGHFYEQLAAWVPRIIYALVAIKVIWGIFASGGVAPRVPTDL